MIIANRINGMYLHQTHHHLLKGKPTLNYKTELETYQYSIERWYMNLRFSECFYLCFLSLFTLDY